MIDDTTISHKRERKALGWFGNQLAGVIIGYILGGTLSSVLSIFVTLLLLMKAGLLRLSHWPGTAFIVLAIIVSIIIVLVFGLAVVYLLRLLIHELLVAFCRLFKMEPPKRSRLLMPLDSLTEWVMRTAEKVMEWQEERAYRRTERSASSQGNSNQT